jgi:hypothetical protein
VLIDQRHWRGNLGIRSGDKFTVVIKATEVMIAK